MKILHIIISILLMSNFLLAQITDFDHEYGDIPQEQLEMTVYDKDSTAAGVQLLNYCKVYYDDYSFHEEGMYYNYHIRLKVLDNSKFDTKDIKLYSSYYNDIQTVKAQTINNENGKIKITSIENIHSKEIDEHRKIYVINFPNVSNGSILEYQYSMFVANKMFIKTFYAQNQHPIIRSEYRIAIPENKSYNVLLKGVKKPTENGKQNFVNKAVFYKAMEYSWIYQDVPPMKEEKFTTTLENYIAKIDVQLNEEVLTLSGALKTGVANSSFFKSWTELGYLYFDYHKPLIGEMFQIRPVYNEVKPLLKDITTTKDSILRIYDFVQSNMDWDSRYWFFLDQKPRDAFAAKKGTSADMNFVLMSLLYNFDFETYPILLSTRNHGKVDVKHPFVNQFNHTIIAVNTGEEWLFLDAIDKSLPYDLLPIADLNYEGLLINNDTSYFINIPFEPSETVTYIKAKLDENGTISGILNLAETNYIGAKSRQKIYTDGKTDYQNNFFKDIWTDAKATDIQFKNLDDKEKRLNQTITFEAKNVGQVNGELMYLDIFMGLGLDENPFQLEKRNYPVELPYPLKETILLNIEIPDGYMVESLPEPVRYNLPNGDGSFTFAAQEKNNVITISSKMSIQKVKFEINEYEAIKGLFETLVEKQAAQVVLKKQ